MTKSSITLNTSELGIYWFIFGVWMLLISFQCFVIVKIYKRHKENMEPVHLFQINLMIEMMLSTCTGVLWKIYEKFLINFLNDKSSFSCCIFLNFLHYFSTTTVFCSTSILHYDRYQYLRLKSLYKLRETCGSAMEKIMNFKILSFILTFLGFCLDSRYIFKPIFKKKYSKVHPITFLHHRTIYIITTN